MQGKKQFQLAGQTAGSTLPVRLLLTILFRQRRTILTAFCLVFGLILPVVLLLPAEYAAHTKILIERQRFDPVITAGSKQSDSIDVSTIARLAEQDISSEIELMQGEDMLRRVVLDCNLWSEVPRWKSVLHYPLGTKDERVAKAVRRLQDKLAIEPPNKSNVVTVRYHSDDPEQSARVLRSFVNAYMEKHLQVHRPPGSSNFFSEEVGKNRQALKDANSKVLEFSKAQGVVSPRTESASVLQRVADFDAGLHGTNAQISATQQRIHNLEAQLRRTSPRVITKVRTSPVVLESLKASLHGLELKRSELLANYQPTYRPVQELDKEITETQAKIRDAEQAPTSETTTDQDPVYLWLSSDLAKAQNELVALRANASQTAGTVNEYRARAMLLQRLGTQQDDLEREAKAAEESYIASVRQQSQSRMSEALDRSRIMDVSVAEAAAVPVLPARSKLIDLSIGFALALLVALGFGLASDYWNPFFRSPYEVEAFLDLPVLAAIPHPDTLRGSTARGHLSSVV